MWTLLAAFALAQDTPPAPAPAPAQPVALALSETRVAAFHDHVIEVRDATTGALVHGLATGDHVVRGLAFSGTRLFAFTPEAVLVWEEDRLVQLWTDAAGFAPDGHAVAPDGVLVGWRGDTVERVHPDVGIPTRAEAGGLVPDRGYDRVAAAGIAASAAGGSLTVTGADGVARFTVALDADVAMKLPRADVPALLVVGEGHTALLSADDGRVLQLYPVELGTPRRSYSDTPPKLDPGWQAVSADAPWHLLHTELQGTGKWQVLDATTGRRLAQGDGRVSPDSVPLLPRLVLVEVDGGLELRETAKGKRWARFPKATAGAGLLADGAAVLLLSEGATGTVSVAVAGPEGERWRQRVQGAATPAHVRVAGELVLVDGGGVLIALDAVTGEGRWIAPWAGALTEARTLR